MFQTILVETKIMERHKALHSLSHDHHHGLILAQLIKKGSPEYPYLPKTLGGKIEYAISFYNDELVRHFKDEENILFPIVKSRDDKVDDLINVILNEHKKIKALVSSLKKDQDSEDVLDDLGNLLESHIRKEERELFPLIQNLLNDEELIHLENKLQNFESNK